MSGLLEHDTKTLREVNEMDDTQKRLEVERIVNLIRGFGWEKVSEDIDDKFIVLRIQKSLVQPE